MADTEDLKSSARKLAYGFKSHHSHFGAAMPSCEVNRKMP